jgi:hypothetical protein
MIVLYALGKGDGLALHLLANLVDEVDLPLQALNLPCPQRKREERDDADEKHRRVQQRAFAGRVLLLEPRAWLLLLLGAGSVLW